jgi:hypothetical protein
MHKSVLLDTSFFIRLLNDEDPLHHNAKDYFKYFLDNDIVLKISTISIAEYCVGGSLDQLPLRNIQVLPFNIDHAKRTGEFAKAMFDEKRMNKETIKPRAIIPNDAKLFAQSDQDKTIDFFVTSDTRSKRTYRLLSNRIEPAFEIIDIRTPYHQQFGILDLM